MKKSSLLFVWILILGSCGYKQDPVGDLGNIDYKKVESSTGKPDPSPEPIPNSIYVDIPNSMAILEETELSLSIIMHVSDPRFSQNAGIIIQNISDFPGAKFDPVTGLFSWKPAHGTTGLLQQRNFSLEVL